MIWPSRLVLCWVWKLKEFGVHKFTMGGKISVTLSRCRYSPTGLLLAPRSSSCEKREDMHFSFTRVDATMHDHVRWPGKTVASSGNLWPRCNQSIRLVRVFLPWGIYHAVLEERLSFYYWYILFFGRDMIVSLNLNWYLLAEVSSRRLTKNPLVACQGWHARSHGVQEGVQSSHEPGKRPPRTNQLWYILIYSNKPLVFLTIGEVRFGYPRGRSRGIKLLPVCQIC